MKQEIEQQLGCEIPEELYRQAITYAKDKQAYLYAREGRAVVLEEWYLTTLTEEYIRNLAFSNFTMDLCEEIRKRAPQRVLLMNTGVFGTPY